MPPRRDSLIAKIRALLSKTIENGCTESEYLAALAKARAMQDAYEVTNEELKLTREERAKLHSDPNGERDPHGIKEWLVQGVSRFTATKGYLDRGKVIFVGLPSDTQFAHWLLSNLQAFVLGELTNHLAESSAPRGMRRRVINGFVLGCTARITDRIIELCQPSKDQRGSQTSNGRALVLTKEKLIKDALKQAGVRLRKSRTRRVTDDDSYEAGQAAGDRATFGRPVRSGGRFIIGESP
jgi:hypothetical protein